MECECDPLAPTVQAMLGLTLYYPRQFDRAAECCRKVLAMDPSFMLARFFLGRIHWSQGNLEAAEMELRLASRALPVALGLLSGTLRSLGREHEADSAYGELERLSQHCYVSPLAFAASSRLSDHESRLRWIALVFDEREGTAPLLNVDPVMDDLRSESAFRALIDRLGLPAVPTSP